MRRISTVLLFCALALAVVSSVLLWRLGASPGSEGGPSAVGGPFVLVDQFGHHRSDKDFRGHWMLLYFGYTYCPDVCPTTLALMQASLAKLGPDAAKVAPVFITIDPERDTPAVLKPYLAQFGPGLVGLTGTPKDIARVARSYSVYYAKHPLKGGGYAMDHSSVIYLVDPDGHFVKTYDDQTGAAALAADLRKEIEGRSS